MLWENAGNGVVRDAFAQFKIDSGADYKNITWFEAAAKNAAVTLDATDAVKAKGGENGGAILLGGDGNDKLTGAKGHDLLIGGAGDDAFYWTAGNDILFGRDGDDTYFAGDGELPEGVSERGAIIFVGGEGDEDKVDYSSLTGRIKVSYDKSFFGGIDTSNARLSANPGQRIRLRPDEWKSGDHLWIACVRGDHQINRHWRSPLCFDPRPCVRGDDDSQGDETPPHRQRFDPRPCVRGDPSAQLQYVARFVSIHAPA